MGTSSKRRRVPPLTNWLLLGTAAVLVVLSVRWVPSFPLSANMTELLPTDDPAVDYWHDLNHRFGTMEMLLVGLEEPAEPLCPHSLKRLQRITRRLEDNLGNGLLTVSSIMNLETLRLDEEDTVHAEWLVPEIPESPEEIQALKQRILNDPQVPGAFVSRDLSAYLIVARADPARDLEETARRVLDIVEEERGPMASVAFGAPFISSQIASQVAGRLWGLIPAFVLLLVLPLAVWCRRWRITAVILGGAGTALLWWMALLGVLGVELAATTSGAALVILAVAVATYARMAEWEQGPMYPRGFTLGLMLLAAAAGFLLLGTASRLGWVPGLASLEYLAQFGVVAAMGVGVVAVSALLVVAPLLSWGRCANTDPPGHSPGGPVPSNTCSKGRQRLMGVLFVLVLCSGLLAASQIRFLLSPRDLFSPSDAPGQAIAFLDEHFGGADVLQIGIRGDFTQPPACARTQRLSDLLEGQPLFSDVRSVSQILAMLNHRFDGVYRIPSNPEALSNLWFFLEGNNEILPLIQEDRQGAVVAARITPGASGSADEWAQRARRAVEQSALTGPEGAVERLEGLSIRYGLNLASADIQGVVREIHATIPQREPALLDPVLESLKEWMYSLDSPFEPTPDEWAGLEENLRQPQPDETPMARTIARMEEFQQMNYPREVATELAQTLVARRDTLLLQRLAGIGAQRLGHSHPEFSRRATGILADLLDGRHPVPDGSDLSNSLDIRVSGLPALIPAVEPTLVKTQWISAFILWLIMALASLVATRRWTVGLSVSAEALAATLLTFALGWLLNVQMDPGSALLYLSPPVVAFLASPMLFAALSGPVRGRKVDLPEEAGPRLPEVLLLALGLAGLSLVVVGLLPLVRVGLVMGLSLITVAVTARLVRYLRYST